MDKIVESVLETLLKSGFIVVEVSARHVHLSAGDLERLFGKGTVLTPKRELSQPGQYLSEQRITVIGPKGRKERVAILGPVRSATQVELSLTDCAELGIKAPLRESGKVEGSGAVTLEGPAGSLQIPQGAIVAHNHLHLTPEDADMIGVTDGQHVSVEVVTERPVVFKDVIVRVSENFRSRMHIDFDEANAAMVNGFTLGRIIK
ncbi:MAG: phosphate propanoyltransferase [Clostridiales bacterium]|nr:phosphate propanoyltransferase [Clostridiales bacterium]